MKLVFVPQVVGYGGFMGPCGIPQARLVGRTVQKNFLDSNEKYTEVFRIAKQKL